MTVKDQHPYLLDRTGGSAPVGTENVEGVSNG